ncbi:DUF779 domain-containing protein [Bradyrhizobium sp. 183]|uniref:DUF779 domain-containing protein n=1 Tax=unclassified Bradyrhizobium TaxID=2631580 RepID=UPI001FFEB773|nr:MULTISPECIES: DUF779 domain-containing protein [unclassified Bradyrhizobium]UPJ79781.1 DUF779 domain-containing protein [Bradyrhizobium sp. 184]UPJ87576.1 DUF779 domain-containing protein [Bradyrhizobium sp. 183]
MEEKVSATPAALKLIEKIVAEHGSVLFHQSGGCCDGSSPMCYPRNEFIIGDADVLLGHIGGSPVYISASQFEAWKHTDLVIDVVPGRGGMFSLDNGREVRFLTRSKVGALQPSVSECVGQIRTIIG